MRMPAILAMEMPPPIAENATGKSFHVPSLFLVLCLLGADPPDPTDLGRKERLTFLRGQVIHEIV